MDDDLISTVRLTIDTSPAPVCGWLNALCRIRHIGQWLCQRRLRPLMAKAGTRIGGSAASYAPFCHPPDPPTYHPALIRKRA